MKKHYVSVYYEERTVAGPVRRGTWRFREEGFRVGHGNATPDEAEMDKIDVMQWSHCNQRESLEKL